MIVRRTTRPGLAVTALVAIIAISAGWWALALWPVGTVEPEWLARTRAACFGAEPGGLPGTAGWILLIGEPVGMLLALQVMWGEALRADLRRLRGNRWASGMLAALPLLVLLGLTWSGRRVARARDAGAVIPPPPAGVVSRPTQAIDALTLTDQHGTRRSLAELSRQPTLVTFAFGHCATVCPTVIQDLRRARQASDREEVPLVVMTVDPWRDTPARLATLARQWQLAPHDLVLSGEVGEVESTLDALGITRTRDLTTGDVGHVATVLWLERGTVQDRLDGGWGGVGEWLRRAEGT